MKRIETNITSLQYLKTVSIHQEFRLIILRINTYFMYITFFYTIDEDYLLLLNSEVATISPAQGCLPISIVLSNWLSLPCSVLRNNLYAKNDEQEQVSMRNLEAGFLFKWINLIVGLEGRGQSSPQLCSDEGLQSNWYKNELVWLKCFKCDSLLLDLIWSNRFSVLVLRTSP